MLEVGNLATFEEDRAHFSAWCIVSSPLILGHDLNNSATNDRIWPIVTNKAAISVSQSFAEGSRMHPGGLVRSWTPAPSPGPSPPPANVLYLWAGGAGVYTNEWEVPAAGAAAGVVKHTLTGTCIDAATNGGTAANGAQIALQACNPKAPTQQFVLEAATGELHLAAADNKRCLAVEDFNGPGVVWYSCNTGSNEEFTVSGGALCSKGGHCLTAKATPPPHGGGGGGDTLQIWAKPQPNGATAVLLLNNADPSAPNVTVSFTFAEVGFGGGSGSKVLDIWAGTTADATGSGYTSDAFGGHDARFYLLTPA